MVTDGLPASPFRDDSKVWLSVNLGTGSTTVTTPKVPGSAVAIAAATPPTGQVFVGWSGTTAALANPASANTTATLTNTYTSIRALYRFADPPQSLAAGVFGSQAAVSWTPVSGARYSVYRSANGGPLVSIANNLTANTFVDATLSPGTDYSYSVSSDLLGTSSTLAASLRAAPFELSGFNFSSGIATVSFPSVLGKTYRIERSANLSAWTVIQSSIAGSGSEIQIQDTPPGLPVFYRAVAR